MAATTAAPALEPADAFVASANALAKSASEQADLGRAVVRLERVRLALTAALLGAQAGDKLALGAIDEKDLLCKPRGEQVKIAIERNYLQAVAAKIEEVGKPAQIDNLIAAVKAVFANQTVDVRTPVPSEAEMKKIIELQVTRCEADIRDYDKAFYGREIKSDMHLMALTDLTVSGLPSFAFLGPVGAAIDAIVAIITPAIIDGAKLIDEAKRRERIRAFLADPQRRELIRKTGESLAKDVSSYVWTKRQKLAGTYIERVALLRAEKVDLAKIDACKNLPATRFAARPSGTPSDDFVLCWRSVWQQVESEVAAALKAADDYDQLADAGDSDNAVKAFDGMKDALGAIAEGSITNPDVLWNLVARLIAFADKVNTTFSKENRDKMHKAIDEITKAA
jgi:hypothetical protein